MQQTLAIALLSIRNAIRSRMVICLLALLLIVVILLPLSIKGDGTVSGLVQILLSYTLGLSGFILALTVLWAGSASIAVEINDKTIQMVATKPVSRFQIWLGKWIGLNLMTALVLSICGAVTYGMLQWHLQPSHLDKPEQRKEAERLLTAHAVLMPRLPDFDMMATKQAAELQAAGTLPEGATLEQVAQGIRQQLLIENSTLRPSGRKQWDLGPLPRPVGTTSLALHYRLSSSMIGQNESTTRWLIGTTEDPERIDITRKSVIRTPNTLTFQVDADWYGKNIIVTCIDVDPSGSTLLFDQHDGLELLVPAGSFLGNYLRTLLNLFGQLAFFAAIGVTAGGLLSLPVASFTSLFLLTLIQMGSYIEGIARAKLVLPGSAADPELAVQWGTVLLTLVFKGLALVVGPLTRDNGLNYLCTGRLVDWSWTLQGFLLQGCCYSIVLGFVAATIMKRRELALPSS